MKRLKAYQVHDGDEGWAIVFATNSATARRMGANEIDCTWEEVDFCRRAPQWDQYAPGPVPPLARIAHGWWYECAHCGRRVSEDLEQEVKDDGLNPADFEIVEAGHIVYCSHSCQAIENAQHRQRKVAEVALIEAFEARFTGASIISVHVASHQLEGRNRFGHAQATVVYRFPGGKNSVHWCFGEEQCTVAREDVEAFCAWRSKPVPPEYLSEAA